MPERPDPAGAPGSSPTDGPPSALGSPGADHERVALVTGASRGIGRALVASLAGQGWRVGALARDADRLADLAAELDPGAIEPLVADVTDPAAVARAARRLGQRWAPAELVIANAGVLAAAGGTWEVDPDLWWREFEVNVRGVHATVRATIPAMLERGRGRIVVMSSGMGAHPAPWASAYGASKAAVTHLVGSLATELAGTGVRAFAISPGMVRTEMTQWPEALLARRPELGRFPDSAYLPTSAVCALVDEIASGQLDVLAGRFIHARDDRAALVAEAVAAPR